MEKKNTKGYTLVELITVMAIMGILGTMLVTMMNTGGNLYRNANSVMDAQSNARIAMSYITVKIRQNDVSNGINVANVIVNKVDEDNVIVDSSSYSALTIIDAANINNTYWIYFDSVGKKLMEQNVSTGSTSTSRSGAEITDIGYFNIVKSGTDITFEVKSTDGMVDLTQKLTLRSQ